MSSSADTATDTSQLRQLRDLIRRRWPLLVGVAAVYVVTWPVPPLSPTAGLDASWQAGLHLAAYKGLVFGRDIGFSYGPLGFLGQPRLYQTTTAVLSLLYAGAVHAFVCATVVWFLRRLLPTVVALVAAVAVLLLAPPVEAAELVPLVMALWCVRAVCVARRSAAAAPGAVVWWPWMVGGAVTGLQLLVKFNTGLFCGALLAVTALLVLPRAWKLPMAIAAEIAAVIGALWVVTGAPLSGLPDFFRQSVAIASGYSAAMATEQDGRAWEYPVALLLFGVFVGLLVLSGRRAPALRVMAVIAVVTVVEYFEFRRGFVRHDDHVVPFFLAATLLPFAVRWPAESVRLALGLAAVTFVLVPLTIRGPVRSLADPRKHLDALRSDVRAMVSDRAGTELAAKEGIRNTLRLGSAVLAALGGHTVHVDPYETSAVWAYGFDWRPEPVFQTYLAYTPSLDRENADTLASGHGPERILRQVPLVSIDERNALMEAPRSELAVVCNYREVVVEGTWEVLEKVPDRCGRPRRLGHVDASSGQPVPVPQVGADEVLVAHASLGQSLLDRLRGLLFKPARLDRVVLDGRSERLVAANSDGPLLVCLPPATGYSPAVAGNCPSTLAIVHDGSIGIEFEAVPITSSGRGTAAPPA